MDNSRFKLRLDAEGPEIEETGFQEEVDDLRIDKLSRRITLMSVLIPLLIGAVIALGFFDIKNRFDKNVSSGTAEVRSLSKALESRFSSLSIRQAKLESLLSDKLSELEKSTIALKIRVQKTEQLLKNNISSQKNDEQKIENKLAGIDATVAPIRKEIEKIAEQIKAIDSKTASGIKKLSGEFDRTQKDLVKLSADFDQTKEDIAKQNSAKLDKRMFELALKHEEKMVRQKLEILRKSLSDQLESINAKLIAIEKKQGDLTPASPPPANETPIKSPAPTDTGTRPPASEPGGITEKKID